MTRDTKMQYTSPRFLSLSLVYLFLALPIFQARVLRRARCVACAFARANTFQNNIQPHQPAHISPRVLALSAFSRHRARHSAATLFVSVSPYHRPPLRYHSIYLSVRLSLSFCTPTSYTVLSFSLAPLAANQRGFSARTRRRGSIIHHTNSPEAASDDASQSVSGTTQE